MTRFGENLQVFVRLKLLEYMFKPLFLRRKPPKNLTGFTLIELMVVVAIILNP